MLRKIISIFISVLIIVSVAGCGKGETAVKTPYVNAVSAADGTGSNASLITADEVSFKESDYYSEINYETATVISFSGSTAEIKGTGASVSDGILTLSEGGQYVLEGNFRGKIIISADEKEKVYLYLNEVSVNSVNGPAIYETSADKVIISVVDNTNNSFTDSDTYDTAYEECTACLFFKDSVTINGTGNLKITGNYNDGITSKDTLKIMDGNIEISTKDDGITGRDELIINGGQIDIIAGGHGLKTTNEEKGTAYFLAGNLNVTAGGDGINSVNDAVLNGTSFFITAGDDGVHADNVLTVNDGVLVIAECYEGLEAYQIVINGGEISLTATDDGFNASAGNSENENGNGENSFGGNRPGESERQSDNGQGNGARNTSYDTSENSNSNETAGADDSAASENRNNPGITINGGNMFVSASGDGIDSNGFIIMTGGCLFVNGPTDDMNGAMDYDESFIMTGGTVIALGSSGMYQSISEGSTCGSINYLPDSSISAENIIKVYNGDELVYEFRNSKTVSAILIASSEIIEGQEYTICIGDEKETLTAEEGGKYNGFMQGGFDKNKRR